MGVTLIRCVACDRWTYPETECACRGLKAFRPDPPPRPRRVMVYIAGPLSSGDLCHNIRQAGAAFKMLAQAGFAPLCPHWSCFSGEPFVCPTSGKVYCEGTHDGNGMGHADWLAVDLEFVSRSDAVFRLPGESTGADMEVEHARTLGIPVFTDLRDLLAWAKAEAA